MALILDVTGESGMNKIQQQKLATAKGLATARVTPVSNTKIAAPAPPPAPVNTRTNTNTTGTNATAPNVAAPAAAPTASGGYQGMTPDQYRQSLVDAVKGGVMSEYEANAAIIKNNLAQALSNLDADLAALEPAYQKQVETIAQNQFTSGEATKEIMNQGGWNAGNSGLAIGEQTKIGIAADKSRAEALNTKTQAEQDIARRRSLAEQEYGTNLASLEAQKNAKLSSADANALVQSDDRNRSIYESDRAYDRSVLESDRAYAQARANAARARASGSSSNKDAEWSKSEANEWVNGVIKVMEGAYSEDRMAMYEEALADPDVPEWVRDQLRTLYGNKNKETENYYYNP